VFFILFSNIHARTARAYGGICPIAYQPACATFARAYLPGGFDEIRPRGVSSSIKGYCIAERRGIQGVYLKAEKRKEKHIVHGGHAARDKQRFSSHRDFRSVERSRARARAILPRPEKFLSATAAAQSRLENASVCATRRRRALLRASRTRNPYFSQRLRARVSPLGTSLSLGLSRRRMAKRVTVDVRPDRVAASKTGYGESTKERTIARPRARARRHTMPRDEKRNGSAGVVHVPRCSACPAGKETVTRRRQLRPRA